MSERPLPASEFINAGVQDKLSKAIEGVLNDHKIKILIDSEKIINWKFEE